MEATQARSPVGYVRLILGSLRSAHGPTAVSPITMRIPLNAACSPIGPHSEPVRTYSQPSATADGVQWIFYDDPRVLTLSFHQSGRYLYPGTGFEDETGGPNAIGTSANIPLLPLTGNDDYLWALEEVLPANPDHPGVLHYLIHSYDDPTHAPLDVAGIIADAEQEAQGWAGLEQGTRIGHMIGHFDDLNRAHEAVLIAHEVIGRGNYFIGRVA